ncbi:MAG: peptide-methionine (S)-S-oxide reductase MsrA [Flammeovirgaceae bacterium]|jgi:peptide-methionine (S)-S-oxide reductase|nr:peptide-methionine (S)-S-oxide reductase MsrA [Flammeovirgaceae bacterium]
MKFNKRSLLFIACGLMVSVSCVSKAEKPAITSFSASISQMPQSSKVDTATFAGGCFWCIEASFEQINGIYEAISGYAGGNATDADYSKVSNGQTNHAETVQIIFNPDQINYETLLDIFFTAHDPTQLNRQGPDVGKQYRSVIFYHSEEQKMNAEIKIKQLTPQFGRKIVTLIDPLEAFYPAEAYHQDYERRNPYQPYVLNVSRPKIDLVAAKFKNILKPTNK